MKAIPKSVLIIIILFLGINLINAQEITPGIYVDNIKVSELSCYSFGDMHVVLPYKNEYQSFDLLKLLMSTSDGANTKEISKNSMQSFVKGNFIIFQVFDAGKQSANGYNRGSVEGSLTRGALANFWVVNDVGLTIKLWGLNLQGYEEKYDQGCNCVKKIPKYKDEELYSIKIVLNERKKIRGLMAGVTNNPSLKEVDLSQPCPISGTKVEFNKLGNNGSSSNTSINSNTNTTQANNTSAKIETQVKTSGGASGKTFITTAAPTSANAVKPLDKAKSGYFEEKSEDKKIMYRNGYQKSEGVYHGEVREYENNQLEKIIMYTDGVEDGLYISFSGGKVECIGNYKNGNKDGVWKHFKNGILEETENYINGEKQD